MDVAQRYLTPNAQETPLSCTFSSSSGRLARRKNNTTVRFRRLFLPNSLAASGADPSTRKTRSRTDCEATRGPVRVVAAGFCPSALLSGAPQTRAPYERAMPRYQARGSWKSPAPRRRGACFLIPRTLVFRDGYPSTSRRCESRRNSLPRTGNPRLSLQHFT